MAWIKLEHHTPDKPELWAVAESLGVDIDLVVGKFVRLIVWADQNVSAERPHCVLTLSALSAKFGLKGFAEALAQVGWLREVDGKTEFINFDRHNGNSAKRRGLDAERKRSNRVRKASASCPQNVRIKSGPEKRREEKKDIETQNASHSSSLAPTRRDAAVEAVAPPVVNEPSQPQASKPRQRQPDTEPHVWGKGAIRFDSGERRWLGIVQTDRDSWAKAYPAVDVDRQLAAMGEWIRANPAKGRKSNYAKFITNWLSREQDRGGDNGHTDRRKDTPRGAGTDRRDAQGPGHPGGRAVLPPGLAGLVANRDGHRHGRAEAC